MKKYPIKHSILAIAVSVLASPAVAQPYDWSGFYAGLQGGWAFGDVDSSLAVPAGSNINAAATGLALLIGNNDFDTNGVTVGALAGMNWQNGSFVFGIEGDVNYVGLNETNIMPGTFGGATGRTIDEIDINILATLRGRLGFANNNWLFYGTGGVAFSDADYNRALEWSFADGCPLGTTGLNRCHVGSDSFSAGYTVGGGVEVAFPTSMFSVKAEYLYTDFGSAEFTTVNSSFADQPLEHSADFDFHTVRVGGTIHFQSDRRLKRDIAHIATLENGIKLYRFKYLWDDQVHVGVMAQDLLTDEAFRHTVVMTQNGYYAVNYEALGLKMATLEAWGDYGLAAVTLQSSGSQVSSLVENILR